MALILFAGYQEPVEVSKEVKSHTSAVKFKIVSGKQKGKILKHSEIVAHKQKGVRGSGGGGWEEDFFSRQLQAFINEKKIH